MYLPVTRKPKNSAGFGNPTVYGSATGPIVAAAPSLKRFGHHTFDFGSRRVTASELARCQATAPLTNVKLGTYSPSLYHPP